MTSLLILMQEHNIPVWALAAIPVILALLVIFGFWFISTRIFKMRLQRILKAQDAMQAEDAITVFSRHYPPEKLVRYSRRMERYSRQMGPEVVRKTGLADKWTIKLKKSSLVRAQDIRRVLLYCPESSLFKAYLAAEQHPRLRKVFNNWMKTKGEEKVIHLLADSCRGEEFTPDYGKYFLENHSDVLRELTGEPEWYARYFGYKILLLDKETLTERSLEDGLKDPHPLVRKIITKGFSANREKIWSVLWDKLVHDPVFEVRETARRRIADEFMDLYSLNDKTLNEEETSRILEQLDPDCQEDRTFAMAAMQSSNKEQRYHAASFLQKCGILSSLHAKNVMDDPTNIEHTSDILQRAMEVNVFGFLNEYPSGDGAPLLIVSRLLSEFGGTPDHIYLLAKKTFAFFSDKKLEPSNKEIYAKTLEAISKEGGISSITLYAEELSHRETDKLFLDVLLPRIPNKEGLIFLPVLFRFLGNVNFPAREELSKIMGTFSPDMILPGVYTILDGDRAKYPHEVRISALKILGLLRQPFCLQRILESLPTFRPDEIEEFGKLIADYPQDIFEEKVGKLLASPDAKIRASLITILPVTKNDTFLKEIRASLKDVDPDVRVASIKALLGFGEIKLLNQETSMLRDPVERVRLATTEVIARYGNADALEILKTILTDESETDVVKKGVIGGLGQATNAEGIPILVYALDTIEEFRKCTEEALAMRTAKKDIIKLIEIFKDAEPQLREKLIPVFKAQGRKAEQWILEILKDEVASLKPYLVRILEESGYVDEAKRRLSHRKVENRREAAMLLSLLDTLPAFRGLVMAAKDPDQEVRVCVVKALEKLSGSQSREILESLKHDPDNRIRKYTAWALERLDSLAME